MAFPRVQFSNLFPGEHAPGPPHIIRAFRADSQLVSSNNLVLNVQLQKNLCQDKTNDDTKSE